MTWPATIFRGALAALAALALSGCVPSAQSQADEEKEPHFMAGKKRVSTLDYSGAIESFEKALEINPRSAAAHFELGWLFDQRETDPAAAIYHYQSYLKLRPDAGNGLVVKQRIMTCKQELARNVSLGPLTERQQREFEQVLDENKKLGGEVKRLNDELERWKTYAAGLAGNPNQPGAAAARIRAPATPSTFTNFGAPTTPSGPTNPPVPATKTHTVKAGETPTAIAKKYGLKVEVLLTANPRVDARRLKVGQVLVIPIP
ncbi:MAG TPA: LysM peptidoglycan-binding domain-containing protein [Verrucomicrobiae bacterium]